MAGQRIEKPAEIAALINKSVYAVLSMSDGDTPYAVPINAVWDGKDFYLHSRHGGRKIEVLRKNRKVTLTFVPQASFVVRHERSSCGASMDFESVCASGVAEILGADSDPDARREALMVIIRHYGLERLPMDEAVFAKTSVIRVRCHSLVAMRKPGIS